MAELGRSSRPVPVPGEGLLGGPPGLCAQPAPGDRFVAGCFPARRCRCCDSFQVPAWTWAQPGGVQSASVQFSGPKRSSGPQAGDSLALTLRRQAGGVDVVIEGTGATPVMQQGRNGSSWVGQLTTASPAVLRYGAQNLSLPEAGIQSISLQGSGSSYQVQVVPMPGLPLARPVIGADGRNLVISFTTVPQLSSQTARPNLRTPAPCPRPPMPQACSPGLWRRPWEIWLWARWCCAIAVSSTSMAQRLT
jgi:hypothetical protein